MATKLPRVLWTDAFKALEKAGFTLSGRTGAGSHHYLHHADGRAVQLDKLTLGEMPPVVLRSTLRQAGLSVEEFQALLKRPIKTKSRRRRQASA